MFIQKEFLTLLGIFAFHNKIFLSSTKVFAVLNFITAVTKLICVFFLHLEHVKINGNSSSKLKNGNVNFLAMRTS